MRRHLLVLVTLASLVWAFPFAAYADTKDDLCGNDPNCTVEGFDDGGAGIPSGFWVLFGIVLLVGIGFSIYRLSVVRDTARRAGLNPDEATKMALLDDDGVSTTYLAAHLQPRPSSEAAAPPRSTAERLRELDGLKADGLVTEQEYAERRASILGSL